MKARCAWLFCLVLSFVLSAARVWAVSVGETVTLHATHADGVPARSSIDDPRFVRWPDGTTGMVSAIKDPWILVQTDDRIGWVRSNYVQVQDTEEPGTELHTVAVGAWNLEYFKFGHSRGFPEFKGATQLPPRTLGDYHAIADAIQTQMATGLIALSEVGGTPDLDKLVGFLGSNWAYEMGTTGGAQHLAFLYDKTKVQANFFAELQVPQDLVEPKSKDKVFARVPLVGFFTLLDGGRKMNDLLFVAVHLASGRESTANHNQAMALIRTKLHDFILTRPELAREGDVLIAGDMNADRYDSAQEDFWTGYDANGFAFTTLAGPTAADYKATRLQTTTPVPKVFIDYLFASAALMPALVQTTANVHWELAKGDFMKFRLVYSDHFPITVDLKIQPDTD